MRTRFVKDYICVVVTQERTRNGDLVVSHAHQSTRKIQAFTLIELLVVIAIISLLIGILLPALGSARLSAQALKSGANARNVLMADTIYTGSNRGYHPPSYVYGADRDGFEWNVEMQRDSHPAPRNGYIHWSYALFDNGEIPQDAFESPVVTSRGAPRTNPGPDPLNWEPEQVNALGQPEGAIAPIDRQVPRLAFAANAAIMPRNKFNLGSSQRKAQLVKEHKIQRPTNTILFTEFKDTANWRSLSDPQADGENVIKSHRPITPFFGLSAGSSVFDEPARFNIPRFAYPDPEEFSDVLRTLSNDQIGLIIGQGGSNSSLEAVGDAYNGKTNFGFVDGHVELDELINTLRERKWGEKFYSITGNNDVIDFDEN